jgi:hypothetical protein
MGLRDLWDTIVNNDDICFKHILPKLKRNDIKFLYDVNSETRALIMRSSRKDDVKKKFKIEEMSSISTLEFAWNNVRWGEKSRDEDEMMDQAWFCWQVAETNELELLKWAREEKECMWNENTIVTAALNGNLDILKYCLANECPGVHICCESAAQGGQLECLKYLHEEVQAPWNASTAELAIESDNTLHIFEYLVEREYDEFSGFACIIAASYGKLDCLKYLHETAKAPWDYETASSAAQNGHLHILEYLVERKYDEFSELACENAACNGHLDCLKYLHETAKAPLNFRAVRYAIENNHSECLQYLLDNGCRLPAGWRYTDVELYWMVKNW